MGLELKCLRAVQFMTRWRRSKRSRQSKDASTVTGESRLIVVTLRFDLRVALNSSCVRDNMTANAMIHTYQR